MLEYSLGELISQSVATGRKAISKRPSQGFDTFELSQGVLKNAQNSVAIFERRCKNPFGHFLDKRNAS